MLRQLQQSCERQIDNAIAKKRNTKKTDLANLVTLLDEPIFCPYQIEWLTNDSPVFVVEKSRQIGFSWSMSLLAVLNAVTDKRDTIINSYNLLASKEFIKDCAKWAKIFNFIYEEFVYEEVINNRNINIFELKFTNFRSITAVSGDVTNLRGKPGCLIIIDEAAYRKTPIAEILAASNATLIHGGRVIIGSTHAGVDNDFNKFIEDCKEGKYPYPVLKTTFKQAIAQGLYKRIAIKKGDEWTSENEAEFVNSIYSMYGIRASEELDVIPGDFSDAGKIFNTFNRVNIADMRSRVPHDFISFVSYDLAASKTETSFYTAMIEVLLQLSTGNIIIVDYFAARLDPLEGDEFIVNTGIRKSQSTHIIEIEPGSTGIKYLENMKMRMRSNGVYSVEGYQPKINKLKRMLPVANAVSVGKVLMSSEPRMDELERLLRQVTSNPKPLIQDLADCLSNVYDYCNNNINPMLL